MDVMFYLIGIATALFVVVFIAFPDLLFPGDREKTETVGPVYWGVYEGLDTAEPDVLKKIEIKKSTRKEKVVAGSAMYAKGRGTSFRG